MGYRRALWIDINENMLLGLWKHEIVPPMAWNFRLGDPRMINKFNDTLHTSFVKYDIYQNIHYIHKQDIYTPPTHIERVFERLDKFITLLMHAVEEKEEEK